MPTSRHSTFRGPARTFLWLASFAFLFLSARPAQAMPMFARKYKVDCAMCHAAVPRLNFTGFKFKAAGFRMPWEIDKAQDDNVLHLENSTAFIAFMNGTLGVTSNQAPPLSAQINAQEVDVHPLTGSWGANWSSSVEVDFFTDGTLNLNQAYIGYTSGTADAFWSLEAGVIPNYLGFGALDRPLAVSTPLVLSTSGSNSVQDTLFNWSNPRAAGVSGSYWFGDTYVTASVRNRLGVVANSDGTYSEDAQLNPSTNRMGDVLLSGTTFFDHTGGGSAVNLAYYHGQTFLFVPGGGNSSVYANNFNHLIGGVNYYLNDRWNVYVGTGWGQDQGFDPISGSVSEGLYDLGYYGGLEYFWGPQMAMGGRYDYFRSDLNTSGTDIQEGTLYYHYRPINQIIFSAEYQFQRYGAININPSLEGLDQSILTLQAILAF